MSRILLRLMIIYFITVATLMANKLDHVDSPDSIIEEENKSGLRLNGTSNDDDKVGEFVCMSSSKSNERNGWKPENYRWKHVVIYVDPVYDWKQSRIIRSAVKRLREAVPCLKITLWPFASTKPSGDYIHIVNGNGCSSPIGRIGGPQKVSIQIPQCMEKFIIMHELIHSLGFGHEQCRPDRDLYVTIHEENIRDDCKPEFNKLSSNYFTSFGVPYNEQSIMHYRATMCTINGKPTITSKVTVETQQTSRSN